MALVSQDLGRQHVLNYFPVWCLARKLAVDNGENCRKTCQGMPFCSTWRVTCCSPKASGSGLLAATCLGLRSLPSPLALLILSFIGTGTDANSFMVATFWRAVKDAPKDLAVSHGVIFSFDIVSLTRSVLSRPFQGRL